MPMMPIASPQGVNHKMIRLRFVIINSTVAEMSECPNHKV
jgi:hypothetical protein